MTTRSSTLTPAFGATFRYSHTIGRGEMTGTGFRDPVALALGEGDLMYVVSRGYEYRPDAKRITICTVGEEYIGEFARGVTTVGYSNEISEVDGSMVWPTAITLDKEGNVYVADEWLNRISIFTKDGDWIGKWGTPGDGDGEINGPSGLAFNKDDNLYLVDSKNNRIQKFTKDGKFLLKWGREGGGNGEFNLPWGIAIDKNSDVYVADWRNDRIQKFAPDGQFLMKFGTSGAGDGQLDRPTGVAVDQDGIIYVADWGNNRLQVFGRDGRFITKMLGDATLSKWGEMKLDANPDMWKQREIAHGMEREKLMVRPSGVEVDDQDRIFVVDTPRHRIQIYEKQLTHWLGLYDGASCSQCRRRRAH